MFHIPEILTQNKKPIRFYKGLNEKPKRRKGLQISNSFVKFHDYGTMCILICVSTELITVIIPRSLQRAQCLAVSNILRLLHRAQYLLIRTFLRSLQRAQYLVISTILQNLVVSTFDEAPNIGTEKSERKPPYFLTEDVIKGDMLSRLTILRQHRQNNFVLAVFLQSWTVNWLRKLSRQTNKTPLNRIQTTKQNIGILNISNR